MAQAQGPASLSEETRRALAALERRKAHSEALLAQERDPVRREQIRFVLRAIEYQMNELRTRKDI